jgi:hypothetical protein
MRRSARRVSSGSPDPRSAAIFALQSDPLAQSKSSALALAGRELESGSKANNSAVRVKPA